ncbi:MAG TPA: gluconokinase [Chthonomonadaceae bacterium]|nr:gluconokinase [Chthonomonadaceae bacterium]
MNDTPLTLTLDIGTSSTRALLWDTNGAEVEGVRAQTPYQMRTTPDGGVEMPAEEMLAHVGECLDQALAQAGDRAQAIRAVGISTFWHSLLGLDAGGEPITPIYSWADTRAADAARALRERLDESAVHARTGCVIHPSYYPAKLAWLQEAQPELICRVARWVSPSEFLFARFFGPDACRVSVSMASGTGLMNQEQGRWDGETLAALGLPEEKLSPIVDLSASSQGLQGEFAARWPALRDVPFFPAVGDGACSNVGSGCVSPERFAINLGTSGAIRAIWEETQGRGKREAGSVGAQQVAPSAASPLSRSVGEGSGVRVTSSPTPPGLWRYRVDARRPILGAAFSDGGSVYAWMKRTLRLPPDEELERRLAAMEPGAHGLSFLPFLSGERSLGWHPDARGALVGMNLDTHPVEMLRAAMEAVAMQFALAAERLRKRFPQAREIIASGGALGHSPAWTQMFADALGQPVTLAAEAEASSRGAALLAMEAAGLIESVRTPEARLGTTFTPDESRHARYAEMQARQQRYYARLIEEP